MNNIEQAELKFYCRGCGERQSVTIEPLKFDDLNDDAWGDIVCNKCRLVIATMSSSREGGLGFVSAFDIRELI